MRASVTRPWMAYEPLPGTSLLASWPIYLTNFNLFLQVVYLNGGALATGLYFFRHFTDGVPLPRRMPLVVRVTWLFRTWAVPSTFCVFGLYWTLLFPSTWRYFEFSRDVLPHMANLVLQMVDTHLSYEPFFFKPAYWAMHLYNFGYFGWSIVHYFAGVTNGMCGNYIYYFLNWGEWPAFATFLFVAFIIGGVPFFCFNSMHHTKTCRPRAQRELAFGPLASNPKSEMMPVAAAPAAA